MYTEARYGVNRWFLGPLLNEPVITVIYARRFRLGKCILAALIPTDKFTLEMTCDVDMGYTKVYSLPPLFIQGGRYLRLMYWLPDVKPNEQRLVRTQAKMLATWTREFFDMPTIISPIGGLIEARWKLRAF